MTTTQQQQQEGRPKERQDSPPKRARTEMQDKQVQSPTVHTADDPPERSPGLASPAVTENQVFFERYTDSPEFSRVKNPVVHMRNRMDPNDEDASDVIDPTSKLANYQSPMDRLKSDPMDLRRLAAFGAHKQASASIAITKHDKSGTGNTAPGVERVLSEDDEESSVGDDDEEPEDDTFEFLLKKY